MTANEHDENPAAGPLADDAAVTDPAPSSFDAEVDPQAPVEGEDQQGESDENDSHPVDVGAVESDDESALSEPDSDADDESDADEIALSEPDSDADDESDADEIALPAGEDEDGTPDTSVLVAAAPASRASRRGTAKRPGLPFLTVLGACLALAAIGYAVVDVLTDYADLALSPLLGRAFLGAQAILALCVAAAALTSVMMTERRAAHAAKNPTLDDAIDDLAFARERIAEVEQAHHARGLEVNDLRAALAAEQARSETAAALVSASHAERDQAAADLTRYLATRPPNEAEIRDHVTREIAAAHQVSLAELDSAHERMVAGLRARINDAEGAAQREATARAAAEASVAVACEKTRAEERARMRITVQALVLAARDALGEDAKPVTQFADRFIEAVDRLDGPAASSPAMPIRAVASRGALDGSEDAGARTTWFRRPRRK